MKTLVIRNFGPIRDLEVDIRPVTFFIGPQGCGKSTVSKICTIFQDVQWVLDVIKRSDRIKDPFEKFGINDFFKKETFIRFRDSDNTFETVFEKGEFQVNTFGNETLETLQNLLQGLISFSNRGLLKRLGISDSEVPQIQDQYSELLRANNRLVLYVPAERNLIGLLSPYIFNIMLADIPINGCLKEYMSIYEKAKATFPSYEVPFLAVRYSREDGQEKLYVDKDQFIPFTSASSGIQSVLPMIMVINYSIAVNCFDCFVIEEPEQNLYPMNQLDLLRLLLSYHRQYMFTTHSPYLLSALNVFLLAGKLAKNASIRKEVYDIIPEAEVLEPNDVAVYSINNSLNDVNVKSLINSNTGLVDVNTLDGVSEVISEDFGTLMNIFMRTEKR